MFNCNLCPRQAICTSKASNLCSCPAITDAVKMDEKFDAILERLDAIEKAQHHPIYFWTDEKPKKV
jgi:hypothetical protein